MKKLVVVTLLGMFVFMSFTKENTAEKECAIEKVTSSSFSLINDTKEKVSIYTGSGFVSLNKGSKTSIGCKVGKEVRWAKSGSKGAVIFKITSSMCGEVLKLSDMIN